MAPNTKPSRPTCPLGPIDPYESIQIQPENPATWVTLEAKNVPLNPPPTWGFQAKKDPLQLQRLFWTHCALGMPPITKS